MIAKFTAEQLANQCRLSIEDAQIIVDVVKGWPQREWWHNALYQLVIDMSLYGFPATKCIDIVKSVDTILFEDRD